VTGTAIYLSTTASWSLAWAAWVSFVQSVPGFLGLRLVPILPFPPLNPHPSFQKKQKKKGFHLLTNSHPGIAGGPVLEAVKGEERAFVALVGWESVAVHEVSAPPPPILNPVR
jgi:hypothetical protein